MTDEEVADQIRGMFTLSEEEIVKIDRAHKRVRKLVRKDFLSDTPSPKSDAIWKRWYAAIRRPIDIIECGKAFELYAAKHDFVAVIHEPNGDSKRTLWDAMVDDADISRTHTIARIVGFEWKNPTFYTFINASGISYTISCYDNKGDFFAFEKAYAIQISAYIKAHMEGVYERVGHFYIEDTE